MRILLAGASGVLGRAFLPRARAHVVLGLTRAAEKVEALRALGAAGQVCDVYEPGALERIAVEFRPDLVVNFLTDLASGPGARNTRMRAEGGPIVVAAARAAGARAIAVESVAFDLPGAAGAAVAALEHGARASGLSATAVFHHQDPHDARRPYHPGRQGTAGDRPR